MADYQGFARNVLAATAPRQDDSIRNMLAVEGLRTQRENMALTRENMLASRALQERQFGLAENADRRAASADQRAALTSQLDTSDKITKRAIAYATAARDPASWDANVERFASELDQTQAGLGDQVRQYKGRFAEKDAIIASMVTPDTRFSADQAAQRQEAGFTQQSQLQANQQGFTASQNEATRAFQAAQQAEKIGAEREIAGVKTEADKAKTGFDQEDKLRDEFNKGSGDFIKVRDAYGRVLASSKNASPAGDLALVFNYLKVLDPGSTVREGEFAQVAESGGFGARIKAAVERIQSGKLLTPEMRADFVARAGGLYKQQETFQQQNVERYRRLAEEYDRDPGRVTADLATGLPEAPPPADIPPPPPGFVVVP